MAKEIQEVSQDKLTKFDELVKDIQETKDHIAACQNYMKAKEEELLQLCSAVDPTSDFEGTESMKSDSYTVSFIYKLTRKIDKEKADELLLERGEKPEKFFNVQYAYSATLFKLMDSEDRSLISDSMVTKRSKTSIEIKPNDFGKEE